MGWFRATNGSGPSGNVDVEVMRAYGAFASKECHGRCRGAKNERVVETLTMTTLMATMTMMEQIVPHRQIFPNKAPALFVLLNAALESAATMRMLVATGARDTYALDDPLSVRLAPKQAPHLRIKRRTLKQGCRVTINIDVDALNRLRHDTFPAGSRRMMQMQ